MKFTEFQAESPSELWQDVDVRSIDDGDAFSVAAIFAERESVDLGVAVEVVSQWVDLDPKRLVLVAERRGRVLAYGKAEWLSPGEHGGRAPTGWYLTGLVVTPSAQRHGVGARLTEERLALLAGVANDVWYFANVRNRTTIALHERHGFVFETGDFIIPGVEFEGGQGALFRFRVGQS